MDTSLLVTSFSPTTIHSASCNLHSLFKRGNLHGLLDWRWSSGTGAASTNVLSNIRHIVELAGTTLDTLPDLSSRWWDTLSSDKGINTGTDALELSTNEGGLRIAGSQESSVDGEQEPRALGEDNSRSEETAPEEDLKDSNEAHGEVVVLLDKLADGIGEGGSLVGWLGTGWGACWSVDLSWWGDGWENVLTSVGCDVEDGVDAEWKHGQWVLWRHEPDEGHG